MKLIGTVILIMGVGGTALAAESTSDAARRCAAITDSLARLVCYDQVYNPAPGSTGAAASASAPVAAPPAPAVSFGDDAKKKSKTERAAAETKAPSSLTANVTALLDTQGNMYRVTLDNGQVWQTQEWRSMFVLKVGDTVRIDKGTMGGYRMARVVNGKDTLPVRAIRKE